MRALVAPLVLILALCINEVPCTALSPPARPVPRKIVANLTSELIKQLSASDAKLLLVLPGFKDPNGTTLNWEQLSKGLQRIEYIRAFSDFSSHYHRAHRATQAAKEHSRGRRLLRSLRGWSLLQHLTGAAAGNSSSQQQQQQHHLSRGSVALLLLGENGNIRSAQSSLAAAIQRRLRSVAGSTFIHSTHVDKPDTLVVFDGEGQPVSVAVQESSVFRDAFTKIYDQKIWSTAGGGSGLGSSLDYTANIRKQLTDVLTRYKISSMLDSSCGSMHWMPLVLKEHEQKTPGFKFMGTDVVCSLIEKHKVTFANQTNWQFQCVDYSAQPLPSGYELVWSRDSLQHVPMHGAWQFLNNVKASGAKYLLVGSYVKSTQPNKNIGGGDYYEVDLLKPPFSVSKPLEIIDENTPDGKHMLLFEVANLTWSDPLQGLA